VQVGFEQQDLLLPIPRQRTRDIYRRSGRTAPRLGRDKRYDIVAILRRSPVQRLRDGSLQILNLERLAQNLADTRCRRRLSEPGVLGVADDARFGLLRQDVGRRVPAGRTLTQFQKYDLGRIGVE
jgi:hypothetical protein